MAWRLGDVLRFKWLLASLALFGCAQPQARPDILALAPARTTRRTSPTNVPPRQPPPLSEALESRLALNEKLRDFQSSYFQRAQPAPVRPKWLRTWSTKQIASARAFAYGLAPVLSCTEYGLPIQRDGRMCEDVVAPGVALSAEQLAAVLKLLEGRVQASRAGGSERRAGTRPVFTPHHALVFYDPNGAALGGVEVCFPCRQWRIYPTFVGADGAMIEEERRALFGLFDDLGLGARMFDGDAASELAQYVARVYGRGPDQLTDAGKARRARELARGSGVEPQKDARSLSVDERARVCLWFQQELTHNQSEVRPGVGYECSNGRKFGLRPDSVQACASAKITCAATTTELQACLAEIVADAKALCAPVLPAACRDVIACLPQINWRPGDGESNANETKAMTRPTCADINPAQLPHLQSVLNIKPQDVYWVNVVATGQEWVLAEPVVFPRHHALRLEFSNQSEFSAFPEHSAQKLRVSFEVTAQDIQRVPGREQWRSTVSARLLDVCPLAE